MVTRTMTGAGSVSLLVVDDHEVVRAGLASALTGDGDFELAGAVGSASEALAEVSRRRVDVALVDLRLPDMTGTDLCRLLQRASTRPAIVLFSSYVSEDIVRRAKDAGACAFISKAWGLDRLRATLEEVSAARGVPHDPPIVRQLHQLVAQRRGRGLTSQQERVLELSAEGLTYREIGGQLFITESTVRFHVQKLKHRFGARNKTDLVAKALATGVIAPAADRRSSRVA